MSKELVLYRVIRERVGYFVDTKKVLYCGYDREVAMQEYHRSAVTDFPVDEQRVFSKARKQETKIEAIGISEHPEPPQSKTSEKVSKEVEKNYATTDGTSATPGWRSGPVADPPEPPPRPPMPDPPPPPPAKGATTVVKHKADVRLRWASDQPGKSRPKGRMSFRQ